MPKIFISHAHKDEKLVNKFVDTILDLGCGVPQNEIFCTSDPGKGIKPGEDFIKEIKENLKNTSIVILMISPNYYESQFCLGELGATWIIKTDSKDETQKDVSVIVLPVRINITEDKVKALLQVTHMGAIDDRAYLYQLRDIIVERLDTGAKTPKWDEQCTTFLNDLPILLKSLEKPITIPYSDHEKLQNELENAKKRIHEQQATIKKLNKLIEQIENESDYEKIQDIIFRSSSLSEQFEKLIENAKNALLDIEGPVRDIVGLVLFYWFRDGRCWGIHTRNWNTATLNVAESLKFIIYEEVDGSGTYIPNEAKLGYVIAEFKKLFKYPGDFDYDENDPFIKGFSDKYRCEFIDKKGNAEYKTDGDFWENYLGIKFPR